MTTRVPPELGPDAVDHGKIGVVAGIPRIGPSVDIAAVTDGTELPTAAGDSGERQQREGGAELDVHAAS
jgi:hypothetical protein